MDADGELLVVFGALHLAALLFGAVLLFMLVRAGSHGGDEDTPPDEDGGGGGNDRLGDTPKRRPPPGGVPLPDASPSNVRLRGPGRIADGYRRDRRAVPEPTPAPARRERLPS